MTAFASAVNVIFADANMAEAATWLEQGFPPATPCRVVRRAPDEITDFGQGRFRSETTRFDVRVADWSRPAAGDILVVGADRFRVQGEPVRDTERLVWTLDVVPE
jgi:hypothetical protein